jgi:putative solute:sodium symporter small subunit
MSEADVRKRAYWRRTLRITSALLAVWFVVTFGVGFFARDLQFSLFGWPFSFWAAAQGALVLYVLIIAAYAWAMERLDSRYEAEERRDNGLSS